MASRVLKNQRLTPVGLDITPWEVRAVQLLGSPGSHAVHRWAVLPRREQHGELGPIDGEDASYLRAMLERRGFQGSRVVIAAPGAACASQILSLPDRSSGAPIDAIARAEIVRSRRDATGQFALATWYLPGRGRSEQGMAVACERPMLDARLDMLEGAGMQPIAVDLEETALDRACTLMQADKPVSDTEPDSKREVIDVVLQIGWDVSLGVISLGGVVVYTRRIGFGVADMVTRLSERSGITMAEAGRLLGGDGERELGSMDTWSTPAWNRLANALGKEIDTSVTYVSHAYRNASIGAVVLSGFGSQRPEIRDALDDTLGMPVARFGVSEDSDRVTQVFDGIDDASRVRLALAYGLAGRFDA